MVLCFRLHFTKDSTTINTAGATVRQLVSLVFERVLAEDEKVSTQETQEKGNLEELKTPTNQAPKGLEPCAADAYLMFQVNNKKNLLNILQSIIHEKFKLLCTIKVLKGNKELI